MLHGRMFASRLRMRLRPAPSHAVAATVALDAVRRAVSTHARPIRVGGILATGVPTRLVSDAGVTTDKSVIPVASAIRLTLSRNRSGRVLHAAVAAD